MIRTSRDEAAFGPHGGVMDPLSQADFESQVENSRVPALVIFTSPDCKPCRLMSHDITELEQNYQDRVAFFRVDTTGDPDITARLAVVSTPTLILFIGGKPVMRILGYVTKTDVEKQIDENLERYSN